MSYGRIAQHCLLIKHFSETVDFPISGDYLEPPRFKVDETKGRAGYINGEVLYGQDPQTAYQKWCRETAKPPRDLQHFTQSFNKDTVRRCVPSTLPATFLTMHRVVNVPLESGADYRSMHVQFLLLLYTDVVIIRA